MPDDRRCSASPSDGRGAARPPPGQHEGVVPPRARAIGAEAGTSTASGAEPIRGEHRRRQCAARCSSTSSPRTTCRTTSARSSGCSAAPGRGDVGPALDRRGGPALDRASGLPHGDPAVDPVALERGRWRRCRAASPRPAPWADVLRLRRPAGTGHPHRPPQHRPRCSATGAGYEVMKRVAADENLHYLFYRDLVSPPRGRSGPMVGASSARSARSRCPAPGSRASPGTPARSPRPASTTWRSTTSRSSCRSCCAIGASSPGGPRRRRRAGP